MRPIDADDGSLRPDSGDRSDHSSGSSTPSMCYQSCEEELEASLGEKLKRVTARITALHDIAAFKLKVELARSAAMD